MYEGALGIRIGLDQSAVTEDVDIASFERLSIVLGDSVERSLGAVVSQLKFEPVPSLDPDKVWRWRQTDSPFRKIRHSQACRHRSAS